MESFTIQDKKQQFYIILIVSIGAFMANLDLTIVNVALPSISHDFNIDPSTVSRIVLAYALMEGGFLLTFGRIGDLKGFRKVFITGLGIFTVGSLFCGFSNTLNQLSLSRVIQGIGGAMIFAVMMSIVALYIPKEIQGKAMGIVTTTAAAGVALGPPVGGFIISLSHWRWIFLINIPIGIFAVIMGLKYLPKRHPIPTDVKLDYYGAIFSFLALSSFVFAIDQGEKLGWVSPIIISSFLIFIISTLILIFKEGKVKNPLIDIQLLKNRNFLFTALASIPSFMATSGLLFIMPFYLEVLRKFDTKISGLILMVIALGQLLGPVAGSLADKKGTKKVLLAGMAISIISFIFLIFLGSDSSAWLIIISLAIFGISLGIIKAPNVKLALALSPPQKKGFAAAMMGALRSIGIILGVLFFKMIFSQSIHGKIDSGVSLKNVNFNPLHLLQGFHNTFIFGLAISIVALVLVVSVKKSHDINKQKADK